MKNQLGYLLCASIYLIHSIRFIRGQDPLDHLAYTRLSDKRICWDIKKLIGCCADNSVYQLRQSPGARRYLDWSCSHYSSRRLVFGRVPDDPSPSLLFHNGVAYPMYIPWTNSAWFLLPQHDSTVIYLTASVPGITLLIYSHHNSQDGVRGFVILREWYLYWSIHTWKASFT